jgi:hypothetical protein
MGKAYTLPGCNIAATVTQLCQKKGTPFFVSRMFPSQAIAMTQSTQATYLLLLIPAMRYSLS